MLKTVGAKHGWVAKGLADPIATNSVLANDCRDGRSVQD